MAVERYATKDQLQARIDSAATFTAVEDAAHIAALDSASRMIDRETRRFFGKTDSEVRVFTARKYDCVVVPDLVSVSALKTDETDDGTYDRTWASTDYVLWPFNAATGPQSQPYTEIRIDTRSSSTLYTFPPGRIKGVQVTGVWGWPTIPHDIENVCLLEAMRILSQNNDPTGVISNAQAGTMTVLPELHPTSRRVLASYRRMGRTDG
jgi:hypothetical protein